MDREDLTVHLKLAGWNKVQRLRPCYQGEDINICQGRLCGSIRVCFCISSSQLSYEVECQLYFTDKYVEAQRD
jgi:hypothetical protein